MEDCLTRHVLNCGVGNRFGATLAKQPHHDRDCGRAITHTRRRIGKSVGPPVERQSGGFSSRLYRLVSVAGIQRCRQRHCGWGGAAGV